jgi:hypothetical protein
MCIQLTQTSGNCRNATVSSTSTPKSWGQSPKIQCIVHCHLDSCQCTRHVHHVLDWWKRRVSSCHSKHHTPTHCRHCVHKRWVCHSCCRQSKYIQKYQPRCHYLSWQNQSGRLPGTHERPTGGQCRLRCKWQRHCCQMVRNQRHWHHPHVRWKFVCSFGGCKEMRFTVYAKRGFIRNGLLHFGLQPRRLTFVDPTIWWSCPHCTTRSN